MRRPILLLGAMFVSACSETVTLNVEPPWSKDQLVVLVTLDNLGAPLETSPRVFGGDETIELELRTDVTSRVFVRTYSANLRGPNGEPAVRCGIELHADNVLPNPAGSFITAPIDGDTQDVVFMPEDGSFSASLPLGFSSCAHINDCEGYSATLVPAPLNIETRHVALVDPTLTFFSGKYTKTPDSDPMVIGKIENNGINLLPVPEELFSKTDDLTWDPRGWLWVVRAANGQPIYRFDRNFQPLSRPSINRVSQIDVGLDGTTLLRNKDGELFEATFTSTAVTLTRDTTAPDGVKRFEVVRRDRVFAHVDRSIYHYDGTTWLREHEVALLENLSDVGGDEEVMAFVGEIEIVRLRDETTGAWEKLPRPFDSGLRLHSLIGAGAGRFLVVGELGSVAVWTGSYWCPFGFGSGAALDDVSIDASKTVAYAVADQELGIDDATVIVRIEMPPPSR